MSPAWYDFFRAHYIDLWPKVKALETWQWAIDPNAIEWNDLFSPIERVVWGFIREEGVVLYPQHPCAGYFVDFGHPKARVAIECDGKAFHQDKAKDAARQAAIEAKGWTVFRVTGSQCTRRGEQGFDAEGEQYELPNPALALVRHLGREYQLSDRLRRKAA
jgi:very-short-patch-repair endonuclease